MAELALQLQAGMLPQNPRPKVTDGLAQSNKRRPDALQPNSGDRAHTAFGCDPAQVGDRHRGIFTKPEGKPIHGQKHYHALLGGYLFSMNRGA